MATRTTLKIIRSDNNEDDDRSVNVEYAAGDNSDGDLLESPFQKKKKQRKLQRKCGLE